MWIKEKVNTLINKHDTNNPFEIAEAERIHVSFHDFHPDIMGCYKYIRRNHFIGINSKLNEENQRFTCAHELGHSKLHPRIDSPFLRSSTLLSVGRIEQEANRFAVELLIPDKELAVLSKPCLTDQEAAKLFCVPVEICKLKIF